MSRIVASFVVAIALLALVPSAQAQLAAGVGVAKPILNESDAYNSGVHVGALLKIPLIPLQFEAALDRMGGKAGGSDLTILSAGAAVPLSITPPLLPASIYAIAGGGIYRADAAETSSDIGINGGAGARLNLSGFSPFAEARGVMIFGGDKVTYLTAMVGLRF